jgi:hypothetical protein
MQPIDTDGKLGTELVFTTGATVTILCHRDLATRSYSVGGWSSMSHYNQDGLPGEELVFTVGTLRLVVNDARRVTYYL